MESNHRITKRTSPNRDPVFLVTVALAIVVLAVSAWAWSSRGPHIDCPPQDHPVWAQILDHGHGEWIFGASLTIEVGAP